MRLRILFLWPHRSWSLGLACTFLCSMSIFSIAPASTSESKDPPHSALQRIQSGHIAVYEKVRDAVIGVECEVGSGEAYYGAGTVISPDGYILTSTTAIPASALSIRVQFRDGRIYKAVEIERAPSVETVILKIKPMNTDLFPYVFSSADTSFQVGDRVFSAGNPHRTLTQEGQVYWSSGILSGVYTTRSDDEFSQYSGKVLETDAAVNHGCDGGALLDRNGRLMGMVSLCFTRRRGLGTAIPLHLIRKSLKKDHFRSETSDASRAVQAPNAEGHAPSDAKPEVAYIVRIEGPKPVIEESSSEDRPNLNQGPDSTAIRPSPQDRMIFTGVLIAPEGLILTSASALAVTPGELTATLSDGQKFNAQIAACHEALDIALLRLTPATQRKFPFLELARGDDRAQGQYISVLAASPSDSEINLNFTTHTRGIISALGRLNGHAHQMDALVNRGSAGGAVLDRQGRLIGIATHPGTRTVWSENSGVGFFAPSNLILDVLPQLCSGKSVKRNLQAFLGVRPNIDRSSAEGVQLLEVLPSEPAWKAGLRKDDVITAINGKNTESWPTLVSVLKRHQPGEKLFVEYKRGPDLFRTQVVLGIRNNGEHESP